MRPGRAALVSLIAALGCAPAARSPPPSQCSPGAALAPAGEYRYRVSAGPGAEQLGVEVDLPRDAPAPRSWMVDPSLQPYVHDVTLTAGSASRPVPSGRGGWIVPPCAVGCVLRYRVALGDAARALDDFDLALAQSGVILAPPSSWLLHPQEVCAPYALAVTAAPGEGFVSGLSFAHTPGKDDAPAFVDAARPQPPSEALRGEISALDSTPYAAFGRLSRVRKVLPGGVVDVAFAGGHPSPAVDHWIDGALGAIVAYYGRFPIDHAALIVRLGPGDGIGDGHTMGNGGGTVIVSVGEEVGAAALAGDWLLVHELVHVSSPDMLTPWIEEGLATYLEPVIRIRSGLCTVDDLWRSLVEGLPLGQPEAGDGGLDVTDTWGRRYWGGAMFWFLADVEIRKRTGNTRSLDDALLAVNRAGGNASVRWSVDRVLALADAGAGVEVLGPLRKRLGSAPVRVDLDAIWKSLGVSLARGKMVYDDTAPLAAIRKGISSGRRGGP